jgi:hypothetical protein
MTISDKVRGHDKQDKGSNEKDIFDMNEIGARNYDLNEVYRFKDLKLNEYFIALPTPGDNKGHGGYLGAHHVFKKINATQAVRYHLNPADNIMFNFDEFKRDYDRRYKQNITRMSKDMEVIRVD